MSNLNPLQFRLRHLLVAMLVFAISSAVLAPWIRDLSRWQWLRLASSLGMACGVFAVLLLLFGNLYNRARRRLGTVLWEVNGCRRGQGKLLPRLVPYYQLVAAALLVVFCSIADLAINDKQPFAAVRLLFSLNVGAMAAQGILFLRCPLGKVLLGENGILASHAFVPWDKVLYAWKTGGKPTPILLRTKNWAVFELQVPPELEESLAQFLQTRAAPWENPRRPQ